MNPYLDEVSAKIWELSSLKQLKVFEVPLFYRHSTPLECEGDPSHFAGRNFHHVEVRLTNCQVQSAPHRISTPVAWILGQTRGSLHNLNWFLGGRDLPNGTA